MRNISWFILSIGSALAWGHTASFAQDAPRPPVQVVIGPNGVKVIDPKTGKEVPSVVTKIPAAPDKKPEAPGVLLIDLEVENAWMQHLLPYIEHAKGGPKDKNENKQLFKIVGGPDGKPIIIAVQPGKPAAPMSPMSVDKKIDLLLKEMTDLRHDVDAIKKKLDIKAAPEMPTWRFKWMGGAGGPAVPPPPPSTKKDPDKETVERLKAIMEALRNFEDKKEADKQPAKKKAASSEAEIERHLERILREAEELRRELREMQTPKKKK